MGSSICEDLLQKETKQAMAFEPMIYYHWKKKNWIFPGDFVLWKRLFRNSWLILDIPESESLK